MGMAPNGRRSSTLASAMSGAIWEAIRAAVQSEPVSRVRDAGKYGLTCRVDVELTLGERSATIRTAWHYTDAQSPPRLVSAYPTL